VLVPQDHRSALRRCLAAIVLATAVVACVAFVAPAQAGATPAQESEALGLLNQSRASSGLPPLTFDPAAANVARAWAQGMASSGVLAHNPNLVNEVNAQVTNQWSRLGENVGYAGSVSTLHTAFMNSAGHRANILGDYNRVGIGFAQGSNGQLWETVVFLKGPAIVAATPPADSSGAGVVGRADGRLELVDRAPDGSLRIRTMANGAWGAPTSLGGISITDPDVSAWGNDRLDVFIIGGDGALWQRTQSAGAWGPWTSLGGRLTSAPTAVSWGPGRIDVFARGADGALWSRYSDGTNWSGWYTLGGYIVDAPEVASWSGNRLDIFAVGGDSQMWHVAWGGQSWTGWEALGGRFTSAPGATSWGPNRVDVFARGADGAIWTLGWWGTRWGGWASLGGSLISAPDAGSRAGGLYDVVARAGDGQLYLRSWTGNAYSGWTPVP
jgi:hypothetical protein